MKFEAKANSLTVSITEDDKVQVKAFSSVLWSIPCESVTDIVSKPVPFVGVNVKLFTNRGTKDIPAIPQKDYDTFLSFFPNVATVAEAKGGKAWYHDLSKSTHIATYTSERQAQREMEEASKFGWQVSSSSARNGKFSVGKALGGGLVASAVGMGPLGLLAGAVGNKGKITITFTRSK